MRIRSALLVLLAAVAFLAPVPIARAATSIDLSVPVRAEPSGAAVSLDTTVVMPAGSGRHPVVLLAHGFGGSKDSVRPQASSLVDGGFVVITYSARGFGKSGGNIHLDDPDYEVADARAVISAVLASSAASRITLDKPGDPRLGVVGGSYGGALALMLAATDPRVDTVVASITWNDLAQAFFPDHAGTSIAASPGAAPSGGVTGPLKQQWASLFFLGQVGGTTDSTTGTTDPCGRFDPTICAGFLSASSSGQPSAQLLAMLRAHSPAAFLSRLKVPTFLVQGMNDTLFGVDQADATARTLAAQGTPVAMRWMDGGHDGTSSTQAGDEQAQVTWLQHYLLGDAATVPAFVFADPLGRRQSTATLQRASGASYVDAATWRDQPIDGATKTIISPPGGLPVSNTLLPQAASLGTSLPTYSLAALPGLSAAYDTPAFAAQTKIVGAPRLKLTVRSTGPVSTLFLSVWTVNGDTATLARSLVAPIRVSGATGQPHTVDVSLPAATWTFPAGTSLRVLVTPTDSTFANSTVARADSVSISQLQLPQVASTALPVAGAGGVDRESLGVGLAIAALLVVFGLWAWRDRRAVLPADASVADVPLVVSGLTQTFKDGHRAVDDVSWRAERGQILGLLGPNGAGKTTTLRMVLGLIRPDAGQTRILGDQVVPGAAVLGRVGALVEGPGFLPHLTGRANLQAYWAATGRSATEAHYDEALAVAALADAIDRPVRSYSQGMRQRLGIAQAMLGLPEVLILDEPTNGLDPPQIAAMRPILQEYAAGGRTVIVSSHLLAEVEQTCTHIVVMNAGRVVTTGPVAELIANSDTTVLEVASLDGLDALRAVPDVEVSVVSDTEVVVTSSLPRASVVAAAVGAGMAVTGVSSRKHLEDVFLGMIAASSSASDMSPDALRRIRAR
ncbi:ABC-2 type transport system ATP-binding protein [Branchiibius hedensis]|uniref:ABC-2 type transport system ATP-binding protein n=1 Tax=Branchiibius hedensis TaxID=672460 RepID=A0A2Y8ZQF7_9MICO|nr:alpha/beta fold hydrolase [Branchiibius hedensis]PWJ25351.1 ABC-2 type transport system ATP-binding protein [Branchiibius hedensis]SSA34165.1 ABC-2 type transport system ATP-binding protein [Branchiibius hedensis]